MAQIPNPRMKSVKQHDFSKVPHADIQRSTFNRSHKVKTMFDSAYLIPIMVDEVYPGDTFSLKISAICRLATPLLPFMDNIYIDYHAFFIPNRLVWTNWVKMMGEQVDPGDSIDYTVPTITASFSEDELYDYFGIPTGMSLTINNLAGRAYNMIWNNWYRDQNLQDSVTVDTDDGPDNVADYELLKRNKRFDYFTGCLPWPQKGTAIEMPLGDRAEIVIDDISGYNTGHDGEYMVLYNNGSNYGQLYGDSSLDSLGTIWSSSDAANIYADLSAATASNINDIREAFQLQRILECSARSGTRYPEIIRGFFGVTDPQFAVLQRPEFIGGTTTPIYVQPIANTSEDASNVQGHLSAVAYGQTDQSIFNKSFTEHGLVMVLMSARADLTYSQGIERFWNRQTRYDYYMPQTAHLGEQEVLSREIWCDGTSSDDDAFGYQERWSDLRHKKSLITGALRPDHSSAIDEWHLSQDFATRPSLDSDFIEEAPPISRVVAVPSEPEFVFDAYMAYYCTRPLPTFSVPGLIDHL